MKYTVKQFEHEWVVEAINEAQHEASYIAMFSGHNAKALAFEYAQWKIIQESQLGFNLTMH